MPKKWLEGRVTRIDQIGTSTRQFKLNVERDSIFEFVPGQFITMDLPIGEKRLDRWRSYSIASSNNSDNSIELCIVNLEDGKATNYLFNEIKVGSTITFKGPEGQFVLPEKITKDIVMICTGTGVAPFRSMIKTIIEQKVTREHIHLIFGTRYEKDILYKDEFLKLSLNDPSFDYSVCLSRDEKWQGSKGYVHQIYQEEYAAKRDNIIFYLCGWSQMVDEAVQNLLDLGYANNQIVKELYG